MLPHGNGWETLLWHSWSIYDRYINKTLTNQEVIFHILRNLFIALKLNNFFKCMKFLFKVKFAGKECCHSDISSNGGLFMKHCQPQKSPSSITSFYGHGIYQLPWTHKTMSLPVSLRMPWRSGTEQFQKLQLITLNITY
jgi:hypothetical protein